MYYECISRCVTWKDNNITDDCDNNVDQRRLYVDVYVFVVYLCRWDSSSLDSIVVGGTLYQRENSVNDLSIVALYGVYRMLRHWPSVGFKGVWHGLVFRLSNDVSGNIEPCFGILCTPKWSRCRVSYLNINFLLRVYLFQLIGRVILLFIFLKSRLDTVCVFYKTKSPLFF